MSDPKSQAAQIGFEKCERLLSNPDVLWFIAEAIAKPLTDAESKLDALDTSKDARENAAHVKDALKTAKGFLEKQRDIYSRDLPKPQKLS